MTSISSPAELRRPSPEATSPVCLACGGRHTTFWAKAHDVEYLSTTDEFAFHRCSDCSVLFIDPVPVDRLREIYPSNYYSYAEPAGGLAQAVKGWLDRRFFGSVLARVAGEQLRVLDVGGGAGWELNSLRRTDARVKETWVVDLDPNAAELAQKHGHRYFCGRVEDFEAPHQFDVVMLLNLIEHVRDPRAILEKVRSILAPGGIVLIKTPNHEALDARLFRHHSWAGYHCPRHWVLFTLPSLRGLAERAGLAVRSASYTQGAPFWAASVLAWFAAHDLTRVTHERPVVYHPLFGLLAMGFAVFDFLRAPFAKTSQMFFVLERPVDT